MIHLTVVAFGAFTLAAQTVLFRQYMVAGDGGELAVGLFYASWFLWIAVGALLHRRRPPVEGDELRRLLWLLALYVPAAALQFAALRSLRMLAGVPPADLFPMADLVWTTVLANAPVGLITGMAFPVACTALMGRDEGASPAATRGYVLESAGSFAGGLGVTLLVAASMGSVAILSAAVLLLALPCSVLAWRKRLTGAGVALTGAAAIGAALLISPLGSGLENWVEDHRLARALPDVRRVLTAETPYRHLVIGRRGEQLVAVSDGSILTALPAEDRDLPTAALLMAQQPNARRILLIGQGSEGLAGQLLVYDPEQLVHLQPDVVAAEALFRHLPGATAKQLDHPSLERAFGDARQLLRRDGPGSFDLVVLDLPDPTSASSNRLSTTDFFELIRSVLAEDGVLATCFGSTVNYRGGEAQAYGASALATLRNVFDQVAVVPGETTWLFAGAGPTDDPQELARRYRTLPAEPRQVPVQAFASLVEARRVERVRAEYDAVIEQQGDRLLNRDASPIAYFLQLQVLARTTGAGLSDVLAAARAAGIWLYLIPLAIGALLWLRAPLSWPNRRDESRRNGALLLGVAGAAAISLQVCLLLSFQNRFGDLFGQVGWLNALFMAGLAGGGMVGVRWLVEVAGTRPVLIFCGLSAAFALLVAWVTPALHSAGEGAALTAYYLLFATAGVTFGLGFPVAGSLVAGGGEGTHGVGALLESADHWGAALGAAVVGVAMVPLLGPSATAMMLAAVLVVTGVVLPLPTWLRRSESPVIFWILHHLEARGARRRLPWRNVSGALLALSLALIAVAAIVRAHGSGPQVRFAEDQLRPMTQDVGLQLVKEPFVHYRGLDLQGRATGDVLCSSMAVADEIEGYGGPLNLLVAIGPDGTVRDLRLVSSQETPAYLQGFDTWLNGLKDLPLDIPIRPEAGEPVEALTGATVTSHAAMLTVDQVRREVGGRVLGLEIPQPARTPSPWTRYPVLVLLMLALIAMPALMSANRLVRTALLALSAGAAGLWLNQQLSADHLSFLARLQLPGAGNAEGLVLLGSVLLLALAFGPVYCGTLCPFGAAQDALAALGFVRRPGKRIDRAARALKYLLLVAALFALLLTGSQQVLGFDPLQTHLGLRARGAVLALVLLSGVGALLFRRCWCRYLCVVGAFLALFNRIALLRRLIPRRRHDRCDLGVTSAEDWDCIQCNRCSWLAADVSDHPDPPEEGPTGDARRHQRDRLLAVLLAIALGLGLFTALSGFEPPLGPTGTTRQVDVDELRRQIESRELSDHPAEFWEPQE